MTIAVAPSSFGELRRVTSYGAVTGRYGGQCILPHGRGRSVVLWFGPALEGVEAAAGPGFERGEERVRTDRPADALTSAHARDRRLLGFQEVGEA